MYLGMKSQAAPGFVLLLLLLALLRGAECEGARYKRTVSGRVLGRNVNKPTQLLPVPKTGAKVFCKATIIYIYPDKTKDTRILEATEFVDYTKNNLDGRFSQVITFVDNAFLKGDKIISFKYTCEVTVGTVAELTKVGSASGNANINVGDLLAYWAMPLQITGKLQCVNSLKAVTSGDPFPFCEIKFVPNVLSYGIVVNIQLLKDGSFSGRALVSFGFDKLALTKKFTRTSITCSFSFGRPDGTIVVSQGNTAPGINTGNYNMGTVLIRDEKPNKSVCGPK